MNKKERAKFIQETLNTLFPDPPIPLTHKDAYTLLIAVVLSAQCTDARVNTITPKLPKTPGSMIKLSIPEIEEIIRPCGLAPSKSKAIWKLSKIIHDNKDRVPNTFEGLEALPGVGHKTASVIMSQAFHTPAFPVDTHIFRCAKRWKLSTGKTVEKCEKDLKELFPKSSWNKLHLQLIYFARTYCPARSHNPETCPICKAICYKPS